jgi:hypothetical protein
VLAGHHIGDSKGNAAAEEGQEKAVNTIRKKARNKLPIRCLMMLIENAPLR